MRRRLLVVVGIVVVALVAAGAVLWTRLDDTTPVEAGDALGEYRAEPTPGEAGPGLPAPGVYQYGVTGSERLSRGPLDIERGLPGLAPMIVRHTGDGGYETDVRYSEQHTELSRYEVRPAGAFVVFARTVIGASGIDTTRDREWSPALLRLPLRPAVGREWGGAFTAGDLELQIRNRILRRETVELGDGTAAAEAFVIESRQDITGEYTGQRTETFWYAPDTALVVRYAIRSSLDGPTDFDITADQTLTSLVPQT